MMTLVMMSLLYMGDRPLWGGVQEGDGNIDLELWREVETYREI